MVRTNRWCEKVREGGKTHTLDGTSFPSSLVRHLSRSILQFACSVSVLQIKLSYLIVGGHGALDERKEGAVHVYLPSPVVAKNRRVIIQAVHSQSVVNKLQTGIGTRADEMAVSARSSAGRSLAHRGDGCEREDKVGDTAQ